MGVLALGGVLAVAGCLDRSLAGASGLPVADPGPQISDPVSYTVGGVLVFATSSRNPSCSISRNYRNTGDRPLRVLSSVIWDGQEEGKRPKPGTSALDGDDVLEAGEQGTVVFQNHDWISDTATGMFLLVSVVDPADPDPLSVGSNWMEPVLPCRTGTPPTTVPAVEVSAPTPTLAPNPEPAPPLVEEPTLAPADPQAVVLGGGVAPRQTLPATGVSLLPLVVSAMALLMVGRNFVNYREGRL